MRRWRVLVVTQEGLVPPEDLGTLSDQEFHHVAMEVDVLQGLRRLGHDVDIVGVGDEIASLRAAIERFRPKVAFNLLNQFRGVRLYEAYVASYLELLGCAFTGCNPRGLVLCGDKTLVKKILGFHRIPTPHFTLVPRGRRIQLPRRMRYPLFVKAAAEESSTGISQASVVRDEASLRERVGFVHESLAAPALVEEYVAGRELYVSVMGNQRLQVFPTRELVFDNLPEGSEPIATAKVKWDVAYQRRIGVKTVKARLPRGVPEQIDRIARRIYRVLELSGYARIDLRLSEEGQLHVLEVNPNPDVSLPEDFAESALSAGIRYPELLQRLITLGLRQASAWTR